MATPRQFTFSQLDDYFAWKVQAWLSWLDKRKTEGHGGIMDPYKYGATILLIYCAFLGNPLRAHVATLTVATGILMARDFWRQGASGEWPETITDVLMMAAGVFFSQVYFGLTDSRWATLQLSDLQQGTWISMVGAFIIRTAFHANTSRNEPARYPEARLIRAVWRVNLMVVLAMMLLAGANTKAVPGSHAHDFFLSVITLVSFRLILRLETGHPWSFLEPVLGHGFLGQAKLYRKTVEAITAALPLPRTPGGKVSKGVIAAKTVFVMCVLDPYLRAIWRLGFGDAAGIKWRFLASNLIGFALIIPLWRVVKHLNKATVEATNEAAREEEEEH